MPPPGRGRAPLASPISDLDPRRRRAVPPSGMEKRHGGRRGTRRGSLRFAGRPAGRRRDFVRCHELRIPGGDKPRPYIEVLIESVWPSERIFSVSRARAAGCLWEGSTLGGRQAARSSSYFCSRHSIERNCAREPGSAPTPPRRPPPLPRAGRAGRPASTARRDRGRRPCLEGCGSGRRRR